VGLSLDPRRTDEARPHSCAVHGAAHPEWRASIRVAAPDGTLLEILIELPARLCRNRSL
jgi:hypothetical protein